MLRFDDADFFGNGNVQDDDIEMLLNAPMQATQQDNVAYEEFDEEAGLLLFRHAFCCFTPPTAFNRRDLLLLRISLGSIV
jgi:hypothetical protein